MRLRLCDYFILGVVTMLIMLFGLVSLSYSATFTELKVVNADQTSTVITLPPGDYCFVATAIIKTMNKESAYSNTVCKTLTAGKIATLSWTSPTQYEDFTPLDPSELSSYKIYMNTPQAPNTFELMITVTDAPPALVVTE